MHILFITATRVGDAVLSTGLLEHLVKENPKSLVTIACGSSAAGLFEALPNLDSIIILKKRNLSLHWLELWAKCSLRIWDLIIDLRNAPISYLIPCRKCIHLGRNHMNNHRVHRIAVAAGLPEPSKHLKIWISNIHIKKARQILIGTGPLLALGPVANWAPKTWAPEKFVELYSLIAGDNGILPNARVIIFGTQTERSNAQYLLDSLPSERTIDAMGKLSLLEIQACLQVADMYIGNDSGLMHMAAAARIPTLGLFGPSREENYAPWGVNTMVVRGDLSYEELFPENYDYRNSSKYDMMSSLSVEKVYEAVVTLWIKSRRCECE